MMPVAGDKISRRRRVGRRRMRSRSLWRNIHDVMDPKPHALWQFGVV